MQYNSSPVPDAATITIDVDADGTPDVTVAATSITASGNSQTVTYTYPTDGVHDAIVTFHNDASSVAVPISVSALLSLTLSVQSYGSRVKYYSASLSAKVFE